jgi:uncharacterized membrane protein YfcA
VDIFPLLLTGAFAGILAGLLGVGGGIVIVPVVALLLEAQGVERAILIKVAVATSLVTIVVTSTSSIISHQRRGAVDWNIFRRIVPGILVGSLAGSYVADQISGDWLYVIFVVFLYLVSVKMLTGQVSGHRGLPSAAGMGAVGIGIGTISALMGIGGGTLSVPFLTYCGVAVKRAIGTAASIGLPIALSASIGFVYAGLDEQGLPPGNLGYVNLPAAGSIVLASTLFAPLGARLGHALPDLALRRFFAAFLFIMASRMAYGLIQG